jgi:hypothetical protein
MEICTWHIRLFSWLFFISRWHAEIALVVGGNRKSDILQVGSYLLWFAPVVSFPLLNVRPKTPILRAVGGLQWNGFTHPEVDCLVSRLNDGWG